MNRTQRAKNSVVILIAAVQSAAAHEFWIEPSSYRLPSSEVVRVSLWLGERFAGETVRYDPDRCAQFVLAGSNNQGTVVGRSGGTTMFGRLESSGTHILGYRSEPTLNVMEPSAFESYLKEEGLGHVVEARRRLDETTKVGRELYARCAKSIVQVGNPDDGHARQLGFPLEIVPEVNPALSVLIGDFPVRLLYDGKPLATSEVVAVSRESPSQLLKATTDSKGRASFVLRQSGTWMITAIHMVRSTQTQRADWESFWASLTFEIPPTERASGGKTTNGNEAPASP